MHARDSVCGKLYITIDRGFNYLYKSFVFYNNRFIVHIGKCIGFKLKFKFISKMVHEYICADLVWKFTDNIFAILSIIYIEYFLVIHR